MECKYCDQLESDGTHHSRCPELNKTEAYQKATAEIEELVANSVRMVDRENLYSAANSEYHAHEQKIRDAYWRRMMLSAKLGECAPG